MAQKKRNPRLYFGLEVFGVEGKYLGLTHNISCSGCFLGTKEDIEKISNLTFQLPDTLERIDTACKVLWKSNEGVGAKFIIDEKNIILLSRFLKEWSALTI